MSWRRAPAGLVSGPRKLKIVRTASSLRTGTTKRVAEGGAGADMKPKPAWSAQAGRGGGGGGGRGGGREVDARAEGLEDAGAARQARGRPVAVLGQRAAGAGGDQRRRGRDGERRAAGRPARRVHG